MEIAKRAVRIWHETTGRPLRTVAGVYANDVAFYSGDNTSTLFTSSPEMIICRKAWGIELDIQR
jgi:hypothetical protein